MPPFEMHIRPKRIFIGLKSSALSLFGSVREKALEYYGLNYGAIEWRLDPYRFADDEVLRLAAMHGRLLHIFRLEYDSEDHLAALHESQAFWQFAGHLSALADAVLVCGIERAVRYDDDVFEQLISLKSKAEHVSCIFDFEHPSWKSRDILERLRKQNMPTVSCDAPKLPGIVKDADDLLDTVALYRFLGRNRKTWFEPGDKARYDHCYGADELQILRNRISAACDEHERTVVIFANEPAEIAKANSFQFKQLLERHVHAPSRP